MTTILKKGHFTKPLLLTSCIVLALISGCSKAPKIEQHKPSKLPNIAQMQTLTPVFKQSIGGGEKHDPLRLQLDSANDAVYAVSRRGEVSAYSMDGKKIWQTHPRKKDKNLTSGVTVADGLLVVGSGKGYLYGLDAATGALKWQRKLSGSLLSPSLIHAGRVITYANDGTVFGTDAATGEPVWTFDTATTPLSVRGNAAPTLADDKTVILANNSGYVYGLDVLSGIPRWQRRVAVSDGRSEVQRLIDIDGEPVVKDDNMYTVSYQGQLTAIDLQTQRVIWAQDTSSLRSPAVGNGLVYVATSDGHLQAFNQMTGEKSWEQTALAYRKLSNPVMVGRYLVVGDLDGYLHLIEPETGNIVGRVRSRGEITTIRAIDNRLYVSTRTGNLTVWQAS